MPSPLQKKVCYYRADVQQLDQVRKTSSSMEPRIIILHCYVLDYGSSPVTLRVDDMLETLSPWLWVFPHFLYAFKRIAKSRR